MMDEPEYESPRDATPDGGPAGPSGRTRRPAGLIAVAAIVAYFLLAALLVNPCYDTPLYDDWGYSLAVKTLLEEGRLHFTWTATSLLFQVLAGALFSLLFGFSFATLHSVTLLFSLAGILSLYAVLRRFGRRPFEALLISLVTAGTLFYFHFSFTFMNDIPALATLLAAFWLAVRAEERESPAAWLLAAAAFLVSALTRDFTLLLVLTFAVSWLLTGRRRGPQLWLLAAPALFTLYPFIQHRFITMPHRYMKVSPDFFDAAVLLLGFKILAWMGLFFSPLLLSLLPAGLKRGGALRGRRLAGWLIILLLLSLLAVWQYHAPEGEEDRLMPYRPGFISIYGPYNKAPLPGDRQPLLGFGARLTLTGLAVLGSSLIVLGAWAPLRRLFRRSASNRRLAGWLTAAALLSALSSLSVLLLPRLLELERVPLMFSRLAWKILVFLALLLGLVRLISRFWRSSEDGGAAEPPGDEAAADLLAQPAAFRAAAPLYLFSLGILLYYLGTAKFFIRYALLLVPGVLILTLDAYRRTRLNRTILISGLVLSTALGVVFTRDQIAFNEARWAAGRGLLRRGVPADRIEGGFEFNCWHLEFDGSRPSAEHERSSWSTNKVWLIPDYLLTLDSFERIAPPTRADPALRRWNGRVYRQIDAAPYYRILERRQREVQVWQAVRKAGERRPGGRERVAPGT